MRTLPPLAGCSRGSRICRPYLHSVQRAIVSDVVTISPNDRTPTEFPTFTTPPIGHNRRISFRRTL